MPTRSSAILDPSGDPYVVRSTPTGGRRYETQATWMAGRHWEAAETTRLNEAHWTYGDLDRPINEWLAEHLGKVRARSIYESRQNPTMAGMLQQLADDVVGPDGPTLQVQSDSDAYNDALEALWQEWFAAPTFRRNVSGAALLKLWVRNLARCGEYLARIATDPTADGPVKMRLRPTHPRKLASPLDRAGDPRVVMGVEFDPDGERVVRYWFEDPSPDGYRSVSAPWSPDDVIHEFVLDEEGQARGFPWMTPSLPTAADLRDYDDQVQDAARLMADQAAMLYTTNPDEVWKFAEETTFERRSIKMAPPGWQPFQLNAAQPPVQYPDYRAERQREIGAPIRMPLMILRLDSSRHNYSSARFDGQGWSRFCAGIQQSLSGSQQSSGTLNRLVDEVAREGRFSIPALKRRPRKVAYLWTWTVRPHVDPLKERNADKVGLESGSENLIRILAANGTTLDAHIAALVRIKKAYEDADLALPPWLRGESSGPDLDPNADDATEDAKAAAA